MHKRCMRAHQSYIEGSVVANINNHRHIRTQKRLPESASKDEKCEFVIHCAKMAPKQTVGSFDAHEAFDTATQVVVGGDAP